MFRARFLLILGSKSIVMKTFFTAFFILSAYIASFAQTLPSTYTADFKLIFEAAKKYYKTDKEGEGQKITDDFFILEYKSKTHFQGARITRLVADKDEVLNHQAVFTAGNNKTEAEKLLRQFIDATTPLMPANFKETKSVNMKYVGQSDYTLEFNSDVFAEVAKKPTVRFGLIENNGIYSIEVLVMAPVFTFN